MRASPDLRERLVAGAAELGVPLEAGQVDALLALTSVTEPGEMVVRHLLDSLAVAPFVAGARCLDVATGAGLPGLVLAVAGPGREWTLLDSNGKKARFCRQAVLELGLREVEVAQARVEDYRPDRPFDTVTARAWAPLAEVVGRVSRLVGPGGRILALKGVLSEAERAGLTDPPGPVSVHRLQVPGLAAVRHLVVVRVDAP
ncbi:MAG: 16S rRNA (guanine(527)-N(7))-methyltransferase RsmG [Gammaproteobacteria bacterium]|nr:16S rRNA (guanine(527)-N(7))-methyltransferase RsmG [Gammaproteobacteria bacterium]